MTSILDIIKEKFKQKKLPVPKIEEIDGKYYAYKIRALTVWYIVDYQYPYVALYGCKELGISERCSTIEYDTLPDYQKKLFDDALAGMEELLHKVDSGESKLQGYGSPLVSTDKCKGERSPDSLPSPHVSLADILFKINKEICKFIDLDPLSTNVVTLWIIYTYFLYIWKIMPLLIISADDEHHDNMSMLFDILLKLSYDAKKVTTISRKDFLLWESSDGRPTHLFDDPAIIKNRKMLNLIINSYLADEAHICTGVGKGHSFWGAKVLASYGGLPYAIKCRGIVLDLTQRNNSHRAARLTPIDIRSLVELRDYILRNTELLHAEVRGAQPVMPKCLSTTEQDNWEPLFKIAMVVGEGWLEKVTNAATLLSTVQDQDGKVNGLLLSDIHEIVSARKSDQIGTRTLINKLCEKNAELWGAYDRGVKISAIQIADHMRAFGLKSQWIRTKGVKQTSLDGYLKSKIEIAYQRYVKAASKTTTSPQVHGV